MTILKRVWRRAHHEMMAISKAFNRKRNFAAVVKEYGTHMPILACVLDTFPPKVTLEFGMGLNSTRLLASRSFVFSVEHDSRWYRRILDTMFKARTAENIAPILWRNAQVQDFLDTVTGLHWSLALIDGLGASRVPCAMRLLACSDFIILHDTEACCYNWDELFANGELAHHYHYTFRKEIPWTTVICSDQVKLLALIRLLGEDPEKLNIFYAPIR